MSSLEFLIALLCVFSVAGAILRAESSFISDFSAAGQGLSEKSVLSACGSIAAILFSFPEGSVSTPVPCRNFFYQQNYFGRGIAEKVLSGQGLFTGYSIHVGGKYFFGGPEHYGKRSLFHG